MLCLFWNFLKNNSFCQKINHYRDNENIQRSEGSTIEINDVIWDNNRRLLILLHGWANKKRNFMRYDQRTCMFCICLLSLLKRMQSDCKRYKRESSYIKNLFNNVPKLIIYSEQRSMLYINSRRQMSMWTLCNLKWYGLLP